VGRRSKNDNWRRLQSKNTERRRVSMEGKEEEKRGKRIRRTTRNKEGRMLVKGMDDYKWWNKGR